MVRAATARQGDVQATLLLIRFDTKLNVIPDAMLEKIRLGLKRIGSPQKSVEILSGSQKGLWGLFEKTIAISWAADLEDAETCAAIQADVETVLQSMPQLLRRFILHVEGATNHVVHEGRLHGGEQAAQGWRVLFAEALIKWNEEGKNNEQT
jgi:hypothetical protein